MRKYFDLDPGITYLNSGSESLTPRQVIQAVREYQDEYERNPTAWLFKVPVMLWKVQEELAAFLGMDPEGMFLRSNVTLALNSLILGARLAPGGEILMTDLEYGAVTNLCRLKAQQSQHAIRSFALNATDPKSLLASVVSSLRPDTRMLVLSHVITGTGLALPIEEIARHTRERGIWLVVDGAHGVGALPMPRLDNIDAYAGNLHKWMMGPKGTGFGWLAPWRRSELDDIQAGWTTFETADPFTSFGRPGNDARFAARMMPLGTHDFGPMFGISATLAFWRKLGADRIRARIHELQAAVERAMAEHTGWKLVTPPAGPMRGPLLAFELPERLQTGYALMHRLLDEYRLQIMVTRVNGRFLLRLSPHIYSTGEEIDRAARVLAGI